MGCFQSICVFYISEQADIDLSDEVEKVADLIKPDVEERMNIQRIPWIPGDTMEMDDMYHNVGIVKEVKAADRIIQEDIEDYQNIFEGTDHDKKKQRKRVLLKGNPGIGKSTLISKMAYTQNLSSSELLPKLLIQSRFCTGKRYDETKYV